MKIERTYLSELLGDRFDVSFQMGFSACTSFINHHPYKPLGEIAEFSSESWDQKSIFADTFPYIEIGNVDIITGKISAIESVLIKDAPSRAKKIARKYDILVSTTRPNRGAICLYEQDEISIASTGFSIIRNIDNNVIRDFLFIMLRLPISLEQMHLRSSGGNYPAIIESELKKILIPVPPKEVQEHIINIYSQAQQARFQKIVESNKTLDDIDYLILDRLGVFLPSYFKQLSYKINIHSLLADRFDTYYHQPYFDRAFANLKNSKYAVKSLREISSLITSGITPKSGGKDYCSQEEGIAFIRSGDIDISGDIDFDNLLYITKNIHNTKMKSSKVFKNDIMIAIVGATIGQVGIYLSDDEANINQAIALVRLRDGYNPEYIKEVLKSSIGQLNLDWLKRPVARANINLDEIASIMLPIPNLDEQNDLVNQIKKIRSIAKQLQKEGDILLEEAKQKIEKMIIG